MLYRFAESEAWVEPKAVFRNALGDGVLDALLEEGAYIVDRISIPRFELHRSRRTGHVHQNALGIGLSDNACKVRVAAKRGDIVDHGRA